MKASTGEDPGGGEWTLAVRNWMRRLRNSTSSSIQDPGEGEWTLVFRNRTPIYLEERRTRVRNWMKQTLTELHIISVEPAQKKNPLELYIVFVIRIYEEKSGR